jgi:hypothetical protein
MTDTKQKCQGCGAETMSEVGWCLACRSILYTDLQISKSDFRQTEFKTMVFPVRDVIWMQERIRLRDAEIKAMDITNDEMGVTIATLRADLAEARADVARFEAALDAANRELAQARAERGRLLRDLSKTSTALGYANNLIEFYVKKCQKLSESNIRRTIRALVVACRAMWDVLGFFDTRSMMVDGLRHTIKQSGQQAGE